MVKQHSVLPSSSPSPPPQTTKKNRQSSSSAKKNVPAFIFRPTDRPCYMLFCRFSVQTTFSNRDNEGVLVRQRNRQRGEVLGGLVVVAWTDGEMNFSPVSIQPPSSSYRIMHDNARQHLLPPSLSPLSPCGLSIPSSRGLFFLLYAYLTCCG